MVFARLSCPASSTTSRSWLPRGTRPALAKSHAVPPTTQPSWSAMKSGYCFSSISCQLGSAPCFFLATIEASTPAATTSRNRFSTTACDCATTPMRHRLSVTRRAITAAGVKVLPRVFKVNGFAGADYKKLRDVLGLLRDSYCRHVGVEYTHILEPDQQKRLPEPAQGKNDKPTPAP